jgi:hypothetical protein
MIVRRGRKDTEGGITTVRRAYDDLAIVLVPLVSQNGFDALVARALQLAQREYPAAEHAPDGDAAEAEQFARVSFWLDRINRPNSTDAVAAMFAELVALLNTMIGESLTTRYLRKAWPDGFSVTGAKGDK